MDAMTNEEVDELLTKVSSRRFVEYQKRGPEYVVPEGLPNGSENEIREVLWYIGCKPAREELIAAGATPAQVDAALSAKKSTLQIIEPTDLVPIPSNLATEINKDLGESLADVPEDNVRRLDEKFVKWVTEHRVEIYFNEGQHRGRPHVAVVLPEGKVSVSLDDPPVLLTPHGYRGEASALKVVKKHRVKLRKLWDDTRPDDQKLPVRTPPTGLSKVKK